MKQKTKRLDFDEQRQKLSQFLSNFESGEEMMISEEEEKLGRHKYKVMMMQAANDQRKVIQIDFDDIHDYFRKEEEQSMLQNIQKNTQRYIKIFEEIIDELMPSRNVPVNPEEALLNQLENILEKQRKENMEGLRQDMLFSLEGIPPKMHRKYQLVFRPTLKNQSKVGSVSELKSDDIGSIVIVKAIVVKVGNVKPLVTIATYACEVCGCQNYMEVINSSFQHLQVCQSRKCRENNVSGKLLFLAGHSAFVSSQEIKIQETPDQLHEGSIPRTYKVLLMENNTKTVSPGDIIKVEGILLPEKKMHKVFDESLDFNCYIEAMRVEKMKKKYVDMEVGKKQKEEIEKLRAAYTDHELFQLLSQSIAPEIFGLQSVKKSLLLLLAGGVTKIANDNLKIRGQINIALIGDPGVAKSQLLKHISYLSPRGVYTTGKGSTGVGLTAAVVIDPFTHDVSLEAGALVLADMGVCCIDEFDKMGEHDRTAIHEVMEQQTVSIAKAGLTTTLNARTSVLAAANPRYGRYNAKESAEHNINLPAALLSRFDLIFTMLDTPNQDKDVEMARHIGSVHKHGRAPSETAIDIKILRNYIALSKQFNPTINENLKNELIDKYVKKRKDNATSIKEGDRYITTRTLLALIRLCQARAKLRFSNEISSEDIAECEELWWESQEQAMKSQENSSHKKKDVLSLIYEMIKDTCAYDTEGVCDYNLILKRILFRGFSSTDLDTTIDHYERLNVLMKADDMIRVV